MWTNICRTAVLLMSLALLASALVANPVAAAKTTPTLAVRSSTGATATATASFPAYSNVTAFGCGYKSTRVQVGVVIQGSLMSYWSDASIDANGCITDSIQLQSAGNYTFIAEQLRGTNWDVVAQTTATVY